MSEQDDPFAAYRSLLQSALKAAPDRVVYSYAALMRDEIGLVERDEDVNLPGLFSLAIAEALGGKASDAIAAATALSLLAAMGRIFEDIAAEGPAGLEPRWGMPRTLNGGDAFYAVAQTLLLDAAIGLPAGRGLEAMQALDEACHQLSLDLNEGTGPRRSLLIAAAVLGGMFAGADAAQVSALKAFSRSPAAGALHLLPEKAQSVLARTIPYITNRS